MPSLRYTGYRESYDALISIYICGNYGHKLQIPISSHVIQTEYQNFPTHAGELPVSNLLLLNLLQVVNEEKVNKKPSWWREKMMNHNQKVQHQLGISRGGTRCSYQIRYRMYTVKTRYMFCSTCIIHENMKLLKFVNRIENCLKMEELHVTL